MAPEGLVQPPAARTSEQRSKILIDYWMGHENDEMGTRYREQLLKTWRSASSGPKKSDSQPSDDVFRYPTHMLFFP
jgi:hypothetical protein